MGFRRPHTGEDPRIELTPMVDVVFLLLIFFMISTTFVETPGIEVNLPESSARQIEKEPEEFKVYVTREGDIFLGEKQVSFDQLKERLAEAGPQIMEKSFLLLADREAQHGRVVQIMDAARTAGITRLAIATEKRGESR